MSKRLLIALTLLAAGCGPSSVPVEVPPAVESIRTYVKMIESSGSMGSEMTAIEMEIEKLAKDDAAKAAELKKLLEDLKNAKGPAAVKAKAKEMAAKL